VRLIKKYNILFIVIDTLRADYLGCHGGNANTPNIDELAQNSIIFKNAFSASDFTAPSFLSIFSGLYPSEHGVIDWSKKTKKLPLIEILKNNDYKIQGFTSFRFIKQLLEGSMNIEFIGEDFNEYWDINQHLRVTEQTIRFIEENKNKPFFLFYHHSAPHAPYRFPKSEINKIKNDNEFQKHFRILKSDRILNSFFPQISNDNIDKIYNNDEEAIKNSSLIAKATTGMIELNKYQSQMIKYLYKKEIEWTDKLLGKIISKLKDLNLLEKTIICFLADHGELLFENRKFGHANDYMLNGVIKIPCIINSPLIENQKIINTNISHVNILPTIVEMIGLDPDNKLKNRSLWKEISKNKRIQSEPIYSEGNFRIAVINDNQKFITDSRRKSQIINFKGFIKKIIDLIHSGSFSINEIKKIFFLFIVPYYKRFKGISKYEFYEINMENGKELKISKNKKFLLKKMRHFIDEYYNLKKVNLTEELSEEELKIIKVRLEALGYFDNKK
jgi:arylsulfatase A-like enzyme